MAKEPINPEEVQNSHFSKIAVQYAAHYDDVHSSEFRRIFLYPKLFGDLDIANKKVLDAMCGSGQITSFLLGRNCEVHALDMEKKFTDSLKKRFDLASITTCSILKTPYSDESFDIITIIGGLHHLHPKLEEGLQEVTRILKPGGYLLAVEPPSGTIVDLLRKFWYRFDKHFAENEASVDLSFLRSKLASSFLRTEFQFGGGPAYYLIFNSLVTRIPLWLKGWLARPLFFLDKYLEPILPKAFAGYVVIKAQKKMSS